MLLALAGCREREKTKRAAESPPPPPPLTEQIDAALARAGDYLASVQASDGRFPGEQYAVFRAGDALTPLAAMALHFSGESPSAAAGFRRAVEFIAGLEPEGLSYPVYGMAGAILVLNIDDSGQHGAARQRMVTALRAFQLSDERGWSEEDASYGGWSYASSLPDKPAPGTRKSPRLESNLSATLFAIGALRLGGVAADDPALVRALRFVESCQNDADDPAVHPADAGGFFFSPVVADSNKAGPRGDGEAARYRSYGSMTADGIRALTRLGVAATDPRVVAARRWLVERFDPTKNPGDFPRTHELRRASSYYYYAWSVAHALRALGEEDWARPLAEELLERQRDDGSWKNRAGEMREDEPVVATSFAVAALAVARSVLTGEYRSHMRAPPRQSE